MRKFLLSLSIVLLSVGSVFATDLSFSGGVDTTNNYYFRGVKQETTGVLVQPSGDFDLCFFHNNKALVSDVRVVGGFFDSIQTVNPSTRIGDSSAWYESDLSGGAGVTVANVLNLDVSYVGFSSPSGSFKASQEVDLRGSLNDHDLWTNTFFSKLPNFTGFRPYGLYAYELSGHLANRATTGTSGASYLELGVNPGFDVYKHCVLTVPVKTGFSLDNYYNEGNGLNFGYVSLGVQLEVPVVEHVSAVVGVDGEFLGSDVKGVNGDGKNVELNGYAGLRFKF